MHSMCQVLSVMSDCSYLYNKRYTVRPWSVWKIGNCFGSDRLSLGRTFLYGVACLIKCLPYCSRVACNFLQPTSKGEMVLKAAEVFFWIKHARRHVSS